MRSFAYKRIPIFLFTVLFCLTTLGMAFAEEAYWVDPASDLRLTQTAVKVDAQKTIRLKAEVPSGQTLRAYNFTWAYDATKLQVVSAVAASGSAAAPANINTATPGQIVFNYFNTSGVAGPATVALIDVTVQGVAQGCDDTAITVNSFGYSTTVQFRPTPVDIQICVSKDPSKLALTSTALDQQAGVQGAM